MAVVIETTVGDLTVDLFVDKRPRACLNFLKLCKLKYYNYNLFHNIEHGFIAQTGDPSGVGDGGESVWGVVEGVHKRYFEAESLPKIKHTTAGLLSMVSVGKNMVGSQFFFTLGPDLTSLDGVHCVIGEVTEGVEVLRKLNEAIVDEKYRPYQDIRVTHTVILEDPFDDPRGFQIPSRSPSPNPERLKNGRIGADEDIDDTEGKTPQEIQEMLQEREAKARATILEIVGDLPDADIAPPENVLFVCKLNPVTTDDDLEIIFSRFGKVKGCEVIRDKVTGDSLQYAFVEFEDKKACENAYFKMDNVLIDDRRIHVDFSQSVAKVKWRGKGRGIVRDDGKDGGKLDFNDLRGPSKSIKREKGRERREDANDYSKNGKAEDSRPERPRNKSKSRSRSRTPRRNKSRTKSRSPTSRNNQRRERSDSRSRNTGRRGGYDRNSRSPSNHNRFSRDSEYRRPPNNYRNFNRPYGNRGRGRYSGGNYFNSRPYARRYDNRRSRSRSPYRSNSNRSRDRSPAYDRHAQRYDDRRNKYRSRSRDRDDNRTKEENRYYAKTNDFRQRYSNERNRQERHSERETSGRDQRVSSNKKSREANRKKESSSSSSEDTSSSSSESSSSSSEEERRKRRRKKSSKKSTKKKTKKRQPSTSSSDSSSSDSSSD